MTMGGACFELAGCLLGTAGHLLGARACSRRVAGRSVTVNQLLALSVVS